MSKVSVIIPVYNVNLYLSECIESIINQSMSDIEIIIVNDGSTDGSEDICRYYELTDKRIKVINKKNGGLSSARNAGIDIATGEYIIFIDSDDIINQNMIEVLYHYCKKYNCDIAQCLYKRFINRKEIINDIYDEFKESADIKVINNVEALENLYNERYINSIVAWNKLYKLELWNGVRYPEGKLHEDEYTIYKILFKSKNVAIIDEELYFYRNNPNSIINDKYNIKRLDSIDAFEERYNFFINNNMDSLSKKTMNKYVLNILSIYYRVNYEVDNNKEILSYLKSKLKKHLKKIISNNEISLKSKMLVVVLLINSYLYIKYIDFRRE